MPLSFTCRPALVAYLTCGDPDLRTSRDIALSAIEAGAEVIELGVPFSDPVADGPVIQRASERALRHGVSLEQVLELAAEIRRQSDTGLIIFTYLNPVMRMGIEKFSTKAAEAGVDGALITDLPVEEADEYLRHSVARERIARQGYEHVRAHHTYDHRVSALLDAVFAATVGPRLAAPLRHRSRADVQLAYAELFSRARRMDDTIEQFQSVPPRWRYRLPAGKHLALCLLRRVRHG